MEINNNMDIQRLYKLIEELKISINKKEDDIKNIINEKDIIINNLNEKLIIQGKEVKNLNNKIEINKNEISDLNKKIEENKNEIKNLNKKIDELILNNDNKFMEKENKIDTINNKLLNNEKKILEIKDMINEKEKKSILNCFTNITFREKIYEELCQLEKLETEFGFLSSIGIKIKYPEKDNEIEGFIKAPDNSPYKNGIFNFIIKYPKDYPNNCPLIEIKTKIYHCNIQLETGKTDLTTFLRYGWNKDIDLSKILCLLYQFFVFNNPDDPFDCTMADIFKKDYSEFERRSQEFINKYGNREFNRKLNYLFEGKYNIKNNDSDSFCCLMLNEKPYKIFKIHKNNIMDSSIHIKDFLYTFTNSHRDNILIVGSKVLTDIIDIKELSNKIIFIVPNLKGRKY